MRAGLAAALVFVAVWAGCAASKGASKLPGPEDEPPIALSPSHEEPDVVGVTHKVEAGQTLYRIAKTYGVTVAELREANHLGPNEPLRVGQELQIPGALEPMPVAPPPVDAGTPEPTEVAPRIIAPPTSTTATVLQWPLRGVLYARFGKKGKEPHDGIDLAAPTGTPVKTAAKGTVLYAGEQRGYGQIVIVEHTQGLVTIYAHNRDIRVKTGQVIREAQVIATVGESGRTSGPHLHFEVRKDGVPVDPIRLLGPPPSS